MMDLLIVILQQVYRFFAWRLLPRRPVLVPVARHSATAGRVGGHGSLVAVPADAGTVRERFAMLMARLAGYDPATWGVPARGGDPPSVRGILSAAFTQTGANLQRRIEWYGRLR